MVSPLIWVSCANSEKESCPVCYETEEEEGFVGHIPAGNPSLRPGDSSPIHPIHRVCLKQWISRDQANRHWCVLCKENVSNEDIFSKKEKFINGLRYYNSMKNMLPIRIFLGMATGLATGRIAAKKSSLQKMESMVVITTGVILGFHTARDTDTAEGAIVGTAVGTEIVAILFSRLIAEILLASRRNLAVPIADHLKAGAIAGSLPFISTAIGGLADRFFSHFIPR